MCQNGKLPNIDTMIKPGYYDLYLDDSLTYFGYVKKKGVGTPSRQLCCSH